MNPKKTKTQIVGDLLAAALAEVQEGLPAFTGGVFTQDEDGRDLFEATGPAERFPTLSNKHYAELETELGNETPDKLYDSVLLVQKDET